MQIDPVADLKAILEFRAVLSCLEQRQVVECSAAAAAPGHHGDDLVRARCIEPPGQRGAYEVDDFS